MSDFLDFNEHIVFSENFENNSYNNTLEDIKGEDLDIKEDEYKALYISVDKNKELNEKTDPKTRTKDTNNSDIDKSTKKEPEQNISVIEDKPSIKKVENGNPGTNRLIRNLAKKISQKIFNIEKVKKKNIKKGRMTKGLKQKYLGLHNKFSEDNIIRKIKASFLEKSMNYINKQYGIYLKKRGIKKLYRLIQRISPEESRKIRKSENLNFLETTLKKIFSSKLSKKCSLYDPDYNKKQIEELYEQNDAKEVIKILNKTVGEMFDNYCKNIKLDGFGTLEDDLKEERIKMEEKQENGIDDYVEKFRLTAINYKVIFDGKKPRSTKKKIDFH